MIEDLTIRGALEFAVETERMGNRMYQKLAERHENDPELRGLFNRLADDEKLHEAKLDELSRTLDSDKRRELTDDERDYLRGVSWSEVFHGDPDPAAAAAEVDSPKDALELAYRLERATLIFYGACRDILGSEPLLDEVIEMEKHHLTQVSKVLMDPDTKFRGTDDRWT